MPTRFFLSAKSDNYPDFAEQHKNKDLEYVGIFYPKGEPISPHRLHRSPFAVVHYISWATSLPLQQSWPVNNPENSMEGEEKW